MRIKATPDEFYKWLERWLLKEGIVATRGRIQPWYRDMNLPSKTQEIRAAGRTWATVTQPTDDLDAVDVTTTDTRLATAITLEYLRGVPPLPTGE